MRGIKFFLLANDANHNSRGKERKKEKEKKGKEQLQIFTKL